MESANAALLEADLAAIEIDHLIKQTEGLREDVARELFRMVEDASLAYSVSLEIAQTEALGVSAPQV